MPENIVVPSEEATSHVTQAESALWEYAQRILSGDLLWIVEPSTQAFGQALKALGIVVLCYFVGRKLSQLISEPIKNRVDQTLGRFVEKLIYRGSLVVGGVLVLNYFGVRSTSFAAVIAAAGFAIGLAFQGTLANFASGVLLMVFRPFKVGDSVVVNGIAAKVHEVDLFTTTVDTPDNRRLIVPNSAISGQTIENTTYHQHRRVDVPVGVVYSADLDRTRQTLQAAIDSIVDSIIENEERKSQVLLIGLGASSVDWVVRVWAETSDFNIVRDKLVYAVKTYLDANEISCAFPQLELHMRESQSSNRQAPRRAA
jgi:small conductance mechanosensitive channel